MEAIYAEDRNIIVAFRPSKYGRCFVEHSNEYEAEGMHGGRMPEMFSCPLDSQWRAGIPVGMLRFLCLSAILESGVLAPPLK